MQKLTSIVLVLALNASPLAIASAATPATPVSRPTPTTSAPHEAKGLDLSPATPAAMPSPSYNKWPFWTAVGVAVGAAILVSAGLLARGNDGANMGTTTLGTKDY